MLHSLFWELLFISKLAEFYLNWYNLFSDYLDSVTGHKGVLNPGATSYK